MGARRGRNALVLASIVTPIVVIAAAFVFVVSSSTSDPFRGMSVYVNPDSQAADAARSSTGADAALITRIAETPTAIWLTPERNPTETVGDDVAEIVADAQSEGSMPVFVVYGVPERDCGNFSSGGLSTAEYPVWIDEIARGLTTGRSAVIVEPDALALAAECDNVDERISEISRAVSALSATDAEVYIDGGHSDWRTPEDMAELLDLVGVDTVRGFATNVANHNDTEAEIAYAEQVSALLGGAHYVVDTSRNGSGSAGEWCNAPGRSLGPVPMSVDRTGNLDANLWIKAPGESDGTCNGGPAAGEWWQDGALALARNAGW